MTATAEPVCGYQLIDGDEGFAEGYRYKLVGVEPTDTWWLRDRARLDEFMADHAMVLHEPEAITQLRQLRGIDPPKEEGATP
jgi:hypothetical protein